ncbi:chemotaxis protein [Hahella sp. CCB-MM4]|nr:chemotaxis protein [Hahella sp. CCB-MM4]
MVFVALLLIFGAVLGWFHHQKTSDIFLSSSKELFDQIAREINNSFYFSYNPVSTTVRLLSQSPIMRDQDMENRLKRLPILVSVMEAQPEVTSLEVGYSDTEFFIIRRLDSDYMLKRFGAPETAAYVVDNIERVDGQPVFSRLYYDASLALLGEKDMGFTSYNPTIRPWYRLAVYSQDVTTTSPYLYYFIGKVGVTVVNQDKDTGNVFAADITLESLSNTLIKNKVSPSSQMLIYTNDEEVVASLNPDNIVVESGPDNLSILKLSDLNNQVISDFFQQSPKPNNSNFFFDSGGQRWIGVNRPITLVGFTAHLLILAPEHELLQTAYTIRNQSMLISIAIVLLAIPAALFIANQMARPLRQLSEQTQPLHKMNFDQKVNVTSSIRDIQTLASVTEFMRMMIQQLVRLIKTLSQEENHPRLLEQMTGEIISISQADGALLYVLDENADQLIPHCFYTQQGCKSNHSFPRLGVNDRDLELVKAFHEDEDRILEINYERVSTTGTHESLLNHLGADRLQAATFPLENRQGKKIGLFCLIYQVDSASDIPILHADYKALVRSLTGILATAMDQQAGRGN